MDVRQVFSFSMLLSVIPASGLAPAYVSDQELAQHPVVVVGQWQRSALRPHRPHVQRNLERVVTASETFTELKVLRVIHGDIKPGTHVLMVRPGISWSPKGGWVTSGTSTELLGDVGDVTEANIWFLQYQSSWDEKDKTEYLTVKHYREIQPLCLEDYFSHLTGPNAETHIPRLLSSTNTTVVNRVLQYVSGDVWPWPYDAGSQAPYFGPKKRKALRTQADHVATVIQRKELNDLRPLALAVYRELKGPASLPYVRNMLGDRNVAVRAVAAALLARDKDESAIESINRARTRGAPGWIACKLIDRLGEWDASVVPALLAFLNDGEMAYQYGPDLGVPALRARNALHHLTGHWFSFDVEASTRAWKEVQRIRDFHRRQKRLADLLPIDPNPLRAEIIGGNDTNAVCRITNKSRQDVSITKVPASVDQEWGMGISTVRPRNDRRNEEFIELKPGEFTSFIVKVDPSFLLADPASRKLEVQYFGKASDQRNPWFGRVKVEFGAKWEEKRKIEAVAEEWPNGNLKAKGQRMNGKNYGEWHYFSEDGDRIKIVNYTGGGGMATCNPNHPDNKGAGKKR